MFSFKVSNKEIEQVWKEVYFHIVGASITKNKLYYKNISIHGRGRDRPFVALIFIFEEAPIKVQGSFIK